MASREFIIDLPVFTYTTLAVEADSVEEAFEKAVETYGDLDASGEVTTAEWMVDETRAASVAAPEGFDMFVNVATGDIIDHG